MNIGWYIYWCLSDPPFPHSLTCPSPCLPPLPLPPPSITPSPLPPHSLTHSTLTHSPPFPFPHSLPPPFPLSHSLPPPFIYHCMYQNNLCSYIQYILFLFLEVYML